MIDASLDIPAVSMTRRACSGGTSTSPCWCWGRAGGHGRGFFVSGCAVGLLLASAYGRAKAGKHPAFALHLLYWHPPAFMTGLEAHAAFLPARAGRMKLDWLRADIASARARAPLLVLLLAGSMLANVTLAAFAMHMAGRERVVVVPPSINKTFWVESERVSASTSNRWPISSCS